ncbi:MAG: ABC transporter ATP-binding protein/permease [Chloroflexales bacterium]|nr:ABC transporter ATP-binding protein/permease [Chloroflexales bacterium]
MIVRRYHRPPPNETNQKPKTWAERWRDFQVSFSNIPRAFDLVWQAHKAGTIAMAIITLIAAVIPVSQAWVGALIVDTVVASINAQLPVQAGLQAVLPFLLIEFGLLTLSAILNQCRTLVEHMLNARLGNAINATIIRKALDLDLHYFEDAAFYDKLQNARREADWRALSIINTSFSLVQNSITLASFAIGLLTFSPWIALILFGATIPSFLAQTKYSNLYFRLLTWRAPEFRRMQYLEHLLTVDSSAKEVKLFGLGEPLLQRYQDLFWKFYQEDESLARRRSLVSVLWGLVTTASYYGAYAWIIWQTIGGAITLGEMTFYLAIFRQSQMTFQALFYSTGQLYESGLFMDNLFGFLGLRPQMVRSADAQKAPHPITQGIEFRNVSFRYPDREDWALRNINLHIGPGEKLALVGANGAGKTTLIKLLTRLYDPTEGEILLDGIDLREYNLDDLRDSIGVIFQDFVRYQVTARENIGFGQIKALEDEPRILSAAERGGADEVVAELPKGYDTILGRWFEKGAELSGGQWQKMALGRAFMRDSEVLVLDEPTAALDAEREYEIFQRFRELTDGKIAILISHRFSTVRMADRIAVIENGQLTELGDHQELLDYGGAYAKLFNMQAEGYR